jgi:transcriptional regulator with XRE-family HTH domain
LKIGYSLKKLRLKHDYTLKNVAQKLNITSSLLSQIENGKISPSLKSLESLLGLYNVNLSEFFRQVEQKDYIIMRSNETERMVAKSGSIITLLASKLENNVLETYSVELKPGISLQIKQIDEKINGERFIYSISGTLDVLIDKHTKISLYPEDSISFKSHVRCEVKNNQAEDIRFLVSGFIPLF